VCGGATGGARESVGSNVASRHLKRVFELPADMCLDHHQQGAADECLFRSHRPDAATDWRRKQDWATSSDVTHSRAYTGAKESQALSSSGSRQYSPMRYNDFGRLPPSVGEQTLQQHHALIDVDG